MYLLLFIFTLQFVTNQHEKICHLLAHHLETTMCLIFWFWDLDLLIANLI